MAYRIFQEANHLLDGLHRFLLFRLLVVLEDSFVAVFVSAGSVKISQNLSVSRIGIILIILLFILVNFGQILNM